MPLEWLQKKLELELSAEEKAAIEKMGWDELMETLKKRFEEQKERHEGGSKMIGTGGTSPFGAYGYNPQGIRIGQDKGRNKSAVKVWDQRQFKDYDDTLELGTRNIKVALRRLRRFAREGSDDELDLDDTIRSTAANAGWLDIKMVPERHNKVKVLLLMDVGGTMDEHIHRVEEIFSAAKSEFKHLEFYYFHNCVYDFMWKNNRRRYSEKFSTWDVIRKYNKDYKLIFVGDATMSPYEILQPGGSVEYNNEEPGAEWLQRLTQRLPEVRLDQPRAAGRVGLPAEHRRDPAADEPAHVPADLAGARRGHAAAEQMTARARCGVRCSACAAACSAAASNAAASARRRTASAGGAAEPRPQLRACTSSRSRRPAPLKKLLLDYLDLSRFQTRAARPTRITGAELDRLVAAAPAQARALLETEGYFDADVRARASRPAPTGCRCVRDRASTPGPRTHRRRASRSTPRAPLDAAPPTPATPRRSGARASLRDDWSLEARRAVPPVGLERREEQRAGAAARRRLSGRRPGSTRRASTPQRTAPRSIALADSGPLFRLGAIRVEGIERYDAERCANLATFQRGDALHREGAARLPGAAARRPVRRRVGRDRRRPGARRRRAGARCRCASCRCSRPLRHRLQRQHRPARLGRALRTAASSAHRFGTLDAKNKIELGPTQQVAGTAT